MKDVLWGFLAAALAAGCSTPCVSDLGPRYAPANVHAFPAMPRDIRRVAVLPMARHQEDTRAEFGAEAFSAIFETELRKSAAFEVVPITERQLRQWTGRSEWRADEALPGGFFARLKAETGCDAVVFPALTAFRAYPPLAIGFDFRLITCSDLETVWAVDEVLDAGAGPVARAARDYSRREACSRHGEEETLLHSPRRFAQFASATLVATLPPRESP